MPQQREKWIGPGSGKGSSPVVFSQLLDEDIAGKPTVVELYAIGRNMRQEALSLIALGVMDAADYSGYGQLSEDIVDRS